MKRILCALLVILTAGCSDTTALPPGLGSLTGEWFGWYAVPDGYSEWSLSLTELSTGYVAGTFTETSYAGLRPTPEPLMQVDTGTMAGERRGIGIVLTFFYEDGRQIGFEGQQVEANIFRGTHERSGPIDFVLVDP